MDHHKWEQLKEIESPLVEQFVSFKQVHERSLVFFQVGDFFELYSEDAILVTKELGIKLTSREIAKMVIPMCGFPARSGEEQANQLARMGHTVVMVVQEKDEEGNVTRKVGEVLTPGTISSEDFLDGEEHQYILTAYSMKEELGVVLLDTLSGEIHSHVTRKYNLLDLIARYQPKEVLVYLSKTWEPEFMNRLTHAGPVTFFEVPFYTEEFKERVAEYKETHLGNVYTPYPVVVAHLFLTEYLESLHSNFVSLKPMTFIEERNYLYLPKTAVNNLELFQNTNGKKDKTLFHLLNRTATPKGARKLKAWIQEPLIDPNEINKRYHIVDAFRNEKELRETLQSHLAHTSDVERLVARLETMKFKDYELPLLLGNLRRYQSMFGCLTESAPFPSLKELAGKFSTGLASVISSMETMVDEEEIVAEGYDRVFDDVRNRKQNGLAEIKAYAKAEIGKAEIKTMKLDENKVLGFFFEITQSHLDKTPEHFIERAKLSNKKRFVTEELKEREEAYHQALEEYDPLYRKSVKSIATAITPQLDFIRKTVDFIAYLDVLMSFAAVAEEKGYHRPALAEENGLKIDSGVHPLLEHYHYKRVVPNAASLRHQDIHVLTGPNMGGKSTYLKMIALHVIMAQIGSFTPGKITFTPMDRILIRMGAHDSIMENQSTFMVEMEEVAYILYHATENSLILMDELGRGTSTSDGISIAHSVIHHIHEEVKAKTICSTHYHELVDLEREFERVANFHTEAKEIDGEVKLTFRIRPGGSSRSFGIEVAKKVGLPASIIEKADHLLQHKYQQ